MNVRLDVLDHAFSLKLEDVGAPWWCLECMPHNRSAPGSNLVGNPLSLIFVRKKRSIYEGFFALLVVAHRTLLPFSQLSLGCTSRDNNML